MIVLAVAAAVALLSVVALALNDGALARVAEARSALVLSAPLGRPASVRVRNRPFLTQVLRGRYSCIEVSCAGMRIGDLAGVTLDATLHNAYLPLSALVRGGPRELPCERVEGRLLIPYAELARVARVPALSFGYTGDRLMATATLPVPGIGQLARVTGEAVLRVSPYGEVWLRVRGLSVPGLVLSSLVLSQLVPTFDVPIPLPRLPYGLRIDRLTPLPDGLDVTGSALAVMFRRPLVRDET